MTVPGFPPLRFTISLVPQRDDRISAARRLRAFRRSPDLPWILAGLTALYLLWRVNAGKLGALHDYSTLTYADGLLQQGWKPHRDFVTALQALSLYGGWLCEAIFGHHYLALAYGNLVLTLALFAVMYLFTRRVAGPPVGVLAALAVCAMTTLQHAIVWYNGLGILWVVAISAITFLAISRGRFRAIDLTILGALLFLAGSTKLNFMAVGLTIVLLGLAYQMVSQPADARILLPAALLLAISATVAPIWCEMLATGTDFPTWVLQVIRLPSSKTDLRTLAEEFFLPERRDIYKGSAIHAIFGLALFPYAAIGRWIWQDNGRRLARVGAIATLVLFYASAAILAASNGDIASGEVLPLVGLLATLAGLGSLLGEFSRRCLWWGVLLFSVWFLVVGTVSLVRHARLNYSEQSHRSYPHHISDPGYLQGADLSDSSYRKLQQAEVWISEFHVPPGSNTVYWGPGLEIFGRVFQTQFQPGFPLWYQIGGTVRESDGQSIIQRLERSPIEVFIADSSSMHDLPGETKAYLDAKWRRREGQGLVCYTRGTSSALTAPATNSK